VADLVIKGKRYEVELIIFDKDGTLVDFHQLWGARTRESVAALARDVGGDAAAQQALQQELLRALGYDTAADRVLYDGPLAVASMAKLYTIAASVLFRHGCGWHDAERIIADSFIPKMSASPDTSLIRPRGDILHLFDRLKEAGVYIVVVTSDERAGTEAALALLGADGYVARLISGDGDFPEKPAPDAIHHLAAEFSLEVERMMMVGDTVNDMLFGRNGGVGLCVGILGGAGDDEELARHADVVVDSLDQICVIA
jgi:phosphoglycolate phosphatase